jgi:glycosyltransferase involved in cell wall biosynthesis
MRVLHCMWSGETGGAERAVYLLVREQLKDPDLEPAILYAQGRGQYADAARELGCPVIDLSLPHGGALPEVGRVTEVMREYPIHHFHSREPLLMLASMRCRGARRVYTHRGGRTRYAPRKRLRHEIAGMMVRTQFDALSGNTAHGSRSAARLLRVEPERFAVTYNGLDFDLLRPQRPAEDIRQELGIGPADIVIGTVANLHPLKRIDRIIRAVHRLGRDDVRVLVIGGGPDHGRLAQLADELRVAEQVVFAGTKPVVGDYLQVMDVFCLASDDNESFGNAAVEAMGVGIPTIVFSDSPGLVEHIEHGVSGFVVDDDDGIAATVQALADDPVMAERVGEAAATAMRKRYSLRAAADRYRDLYASLGSINGYDAIAESDAARFAGDLATLRVDAVCSEMVGAMRRRGVRPIVLKGPSFAAWLYRDGTRRRYGDVDVLVDPARLDDAHGSLLDAGFQLAEKGDHPLRETDRGQTWRRAHDGATVDLHVRLFGVHAEPRVVWSELSAHTEHLPVGGSSVEVLGTPARALHVAIHAAQHGDRAGHTHEDMRRALEVLSDETWQESAQLAQRIDALPTFVTGLWTLPEGRALATRLVLPHRAPVEIMLRAGSPPPMAVGLDAVIRTPGVTPKLRLFARLAVPSRSWMHAHVPFSRRGRGALTTAYVWRALRLLSSGPTAARAWLRTTKQAGHA